MKFAAVLALAVAPYLSAAEISGPTIGGAAIAAGNSRLLVAWSTFNRDLQIALLDFDGNIVVPPIAFGAGWDTPAVAFDGQRFLIVRRELFDSLQGVFVGEDGSAGASFPIGQSNAWAPRLAWTGSEYLAFWTYQMPEAAAISAQGTVVPLALSNTGDARDIAITPSGRTLLGWTQIAGVGMPADPLVSVIYLAAFNEPGDRPPALLASEPTSLPCDLTPCRGPNGNVLGPNIACNLHVCVAGWVRSDSDQNQTVELTRISADGLPLDLSSSAFVNGRVGGKLFPTPEPMTVAQIVTAGDRFLLILQANDGIWGSWITADLGDSPIFSIAPDGAVAARGVGLPNGSAAITFLRNERINFVEITPPRSRAVRR